MSSKDQNCSPIIDGEIFCCCYVAFSLDGVTSAYNGSHVVS